MPPNCVCANITTTGHWTYSDFEFNSLIRHGDIYLVATPAGIFQLEPPTTPTVVAEIKTGRLPTGDFVASMLTDIYADCRGEMDLEIVTTVDEEADFEYSFAVRLGKEKKHTKRFKLGRGVRGNSWSVLIRNQAGSPFNISNLRPIVIKSVRSR